MNTIPQCSAGQWTQVMVTDQKLCEIWRSSPTFTWTWLSAVTGSFCVVSTYTLPGNHITPHQYLIAINAMPPAQQQICVWDTHPIANNHIAQGSSQWLVETRARSVQTEDGGGTISQNTLDMQTRNKIQWPAERQKWCALESTSSALPKSSRQIKNKSTLDNMTPLRTSQQLWALICLISLTFTYVLLTRYVQCGQQCKTAPTIAGWSVGHTSGDHFWQAIRCNFLRKV